MDPALLELWWVVPAVVGAGTAGVWAVRRRGSERHLGYDAANIELRAAVADATTKQQGARLARTELARVTAERAASRAGAEEIGRAKRALQAAQLEAKAAAATVRHLRARVAAERTAIPARTEPTPMARLRAEHDTVLVQWMQYETDPAKQITYPQMSDAHAPATAAFLGALQTAQQARREEGATPQEYSDYRRAVERLRLVFVEAERSARAAAGEKPDPAAWQDAAQHMLTASADAIDRAAAAAAAAIAAWTNRTQR